MHHRIAGGLLSCSTGGRGLSARVCLWHTPGKPGSGQERPVRAITRSRQLDEGGFVGGVHGSPNLA